MPKSICIRWYIDDTVDFFKFYFIKWVLHVYEYCFITSKEEKVCLNTFMLPISSCEVCESVDIMFTRYIFHPCYSELKIFLSQEMHMRYLYSLLCHFASRLQEKIQENEWIIVNKDSMLMFDSNQFFLKARSLI